MASGPAQAPAASDALPRLAILDTDSGFLLVLENRLQRAGWRYTVLGGAQDPAAFAIEQFDALVVDVRLLGAGRMQWLARLCEAHPGLAILVCTGSSSVAERVTALRLGVADWLSKPCHPDELIARVEATTCSHRRPEIRDLEPLRCGEVEVRPDQFQAFVAGRSLRLTRREYRLLELLARAGGEAVPRELLYESVWRRPMERNDRSVDVFVAKLRGKLRRASPHWRYIHTQVRLGYRLAAEPVDGLSVLGSDAKHPRPTREPLAA